MKLVEVNYIDPFLQHVFGVDTGKTGDCAVDANHDDALESNVHHTGGVAG